MRNPYSIRRYEITRRRLVIWLAAGTGLLVGTLPTGPHLSALPTAAVQSVVYVSPNGSDSNPGTQAQPVQTPQRAQALVQAMNQSMTGDIDVVLEDGFYRLASPLVMGPGDSGSNGFNVVWTAASGAQPVLAGSTQITGWSLFDQARNIWMAQGPSGVDTRQLYVDGVRAQRAQGAVPVSLTPTSTGFTASSATMAGWADPSGQPPQHAEFVFKGGYGGWTELRCPIQSMAGTTITMVEPCWQNSYNRAILTAQNQAANLVDPQHLHLPPTSVENAYPLLTQPGQWYLDTHTSRFYYMPRPGENLAAADVEAPVLGPFLVHGTGTSTNPIHNVVFNGIQFSYATDMEPSGPDGFSEIQANYTITGPNGGQVQGLCSYVPNGTCPYGAWYQIAANVGFTYAQHVQFTNDAFVHLGGACLGLGDGSQNDLVQGSVITDCSGNGLQLGNVDIPNATGADQTLNNTISDNHIFNVPVEYHAGIGLDIGYAKGTVVTHNQIDHTSYSGLSNGWGGWRDKIKQPALANFSSNNMISDNLIFSVVTYMSEGAAIYNNGAQGPNLANGLTITGNILHDLDLGTPHLLYTDNGSYAITITHNGMYNSNGHSAWGSLRTDYNLNNGNLSPFDVEFNYWDTSVGGTSHPAAVVANNTMITSPSQIPASIVSNAGLESAYQSLLNWHPAPNPPVGGGPCSPTMSAPTGATATAMGGGSISVSWAAPAPDCSGPATGFAIYGYSAASQTGSIQVSSGVSTSFTGLTPGTYYIFTITAWDGSQWTGWSAWSAWVLAA